MLLEAHKKHHRQLQYQLGAVQSHRSQNGHSLRAVALCHRLKHHQHLAGQPAAALSADLRFPLT
jgi:hypothetical protein